MGCIRTKNIPHTPRMMWSFMNNAGFGAIFFANSFIPKTNSHIRNTAPINPVIFANA